MFQNKTLFTVNLLHSYKRGFSRALLQEIQIHQKLHYNSYNFKSSYKHEFWWYYSHLVGNNSLSCDSNWIYWLHFRNWHKRWYIHLNKIRIRRTAVSISFYRDTDAVSWSASTSGLHCDIETTLSVQRECLIMFVQFKPLLA